MQTVKMKLSDLHKTDKNIRRHSDRQIDEYIRSLKMFGQIRPLVVTENGEILVGNGMFDALSKMGQTYCDVYVVENMSQAKKRKLMLADNRVYELGTTDISSLDSILAELNGDFDIPGYDSDILNSFSMDANDLDVKIMDYGNSDEIQIKSGAEDNEVTWGEQNKSAYDTPIKSEKGGFINPKQEENHTETGQEKRNENYIICPNCGEIIWL